MLPQRRLLVFALNSLVWILIFGYSSHSTAQTPGIVAGPIQNAANGHQYYLLEPTSWIDAENAAVALGGHLVTINDWNENSWVYNTFSDFGGVSRDLWIGLRHPNPPGISSDPVSRRAQFGWVSGQTVSTTIWAETNTLQTGYCMLRGPAYPLAFDRGRWAEAEEATSLNSVVELQLPLVILSNPRDAAVTIGGSATFEVAADGTPPLSYQWRFDGTNLPGATGTTLQINNARLDQSGTVSVVVSNVSQTVESTPATFTVVNLAVWGGLYDFRTNLPARLSGVRSVSASDYHIAAIDSDGKVAAWGKNSYGELNVPGDLTNAAAVVATTFGNVALTEDGRVVGWGMCWPLEGTNSIAVSAYYYNNLALEKDGTVVAWGGADTVPAPAELTNVVAVAAGYDQNLALKEDGRVVAWNSRSRELLYVPERITNLVAMAAGQSFNLGLRADGRIVGWGDNTYGQLNFPPELTNAVAIAAYGFRSLALTADGRLVASDLNTNWLQNSPAAGLSNITAISTSYDVGAALIGNGTPTFTIQPWDRCIPLNGKLQLVGKAVAEPPVKYQWQFEGSDITAATNDTYVIAGAQAHHSGNYTLIVSNQRATSVSRVARVTVSDRFVTETNHAPMLPAQRDQEINENTELFISNQAADSDFPPQAFGYQLLEAPAGATVSPTGIIQWTPSEAQGPSTNVFVTVVTDTGVPPLSATNSFVVIVKEVNLPPVLPVQYDRTAWMGRELILDNAASDPDLPSNNLTYELVDPPNGATIDSQGTIRWQPSLAQLQTTNLITTVVTDDGVPPLSATNRFNLLVRELTNSVLVGIVAGPLRNPSNGHDYLLLEPATWTNAESAAMALGGHLVTINNPEENTWVYQTFGNYGGVGRDLWIGLFDPDPSVRYVNPETEAAKFLWISGQIAPVNPWQWGSLGPAGSDWKSLGHIKIAGPQTPLEWDRGRWLDDYASTQLHSVVELSQALEIVSQPQNVAVGLGGSATFVVVAEGLQPIVYQWQFGGSTILGATGTTLTLTNLMPWQSGQYSVVASNLTGTVTSSPARLAVSGLVTWGTYPLPDPRTQVPSGLESVLAISAGYSHDLALRPDGTVVCWGDNSYGQLNVPSDLTNVVAISGGDNHSMALKENGTVVVWGSMTQPPASVTNVIAIDAGYRHCLALKADGTVVAWGGEYGYNGAPLAGISNCVAISAGYYHDLGLTAERTVLDLSSRALENPVPAGLTNVVAVSAGQTASLALKADGTVVGWATDISDFFYLALNIPSELTNVVAICAKANHSMALLADGNVVAWGTNWWGESTVPPTLPNTVAIAGGYNHSLALLRDGTPRVTVQPWDQRVHDGDALVFTAKAVGAQPIQYQWQFEGADIPGATAENYAIVQAQSQNAGAYAVLVSNAVGRVSSRKTKIAVLSAPANPTLLTGSFSGQDGQFFQLTAKANPNCRLAVQASSDLKQWITLATLTNSTGQVSFTDTDYTRRTRFYRVQVVQ